MSEDEDEEYIADITPKEFEELEKEYEEELDEFNDKLKMMKNKEIERLDMDYFSYVGGMKKERTTYLKSFIQPEIPMVITPKDLYMYTLKGPDGKSSREDFKCKNPGCIRYYSNDKVMIVPGKDEAICKRCGWKYKIVRTPTEKTSTKGKDKVRVNPFVEKRGPGKITKRYDKNKNKILKVLEANERVNGSGMTMYLLTKLSKLSRGVARRCIDELIEEEKLIRNKDGLIEING